MSILQTFEIICSSSTDLGAVNRTPDGSTFTIQLKKPIEINGKKMGLIFAKDATVWFNTPNLVSGTNSELYLDIATVKYTLSFDSGLYSFSTLNSQLEVLLANQGISGAITFIPNTSTQKVGIKFNIANVTVEFNGKTDTIGKIIGFTDNLDKTATIGQTVYGNTTADFAVLQYYLITCDLLKNGIPINNVNRAILVRVVPPVGTKVGSQIFHQPINPSKIRDDTILGRSIDSMRFSLLNQNGVEINTLGEDFTVTVAFEYI